MDTMKKKTAGIIGGMGPSATVDLFDKIIRHTRASADQEHIHILIDCNAGVPDRTAAILRGGESPLPMLIESAKRLEAAGADFLLLACHTSHYYYDGIQEAIEIPILNMIELTAEYIKRLGYQSAIILGTEGSRSTGIYQTAFAKLGMEALYPDDNIQKAVSAMIYEGVKAGRKEWDAAPLSCRLAEMEARYRTLSVLACTELPIAVKEYGLKGSFVDPTLVLAKEAIRCAGYPVLE